MSEVGDESDPFVEKLQGHKYPWEVIKCSDGFPI